MATSVIEICNNALVELKADPIIALTDDSTSARLCNQRWPGVRDSVLASHPWNSCMKQAELSASSTAPVWKWLYAYPLPSDSLRVFAVQDNSGNEVKEYEVQNGNILSDAEAPIYISYIQRQLDPTQYDALLSEALTYALAARLAYAITASTTQQQAMWTLYQNVLKEARGVDARQGIADVLQDPTWLYAKLGRRTL